MNSFLTHTDAIKRKSSFDSVIDYIIYIDLFDNEYRGSSEISFKLYSIDDIFLDYSGDMLNYLQINDISLN